MNARAQHFSDVGQRGEGSNGVGYCASYTLALAELCGLAWARKVEFFSVGRCRVRHQRVVEFFCHLYGTKVELVSKTRHRCRLTGTHSVRVSRRV